MSEGTSQGMTDDEIREQLVAQDWENLSGLDLETGVVLFKKALDKAGDEQTVSTMTRGRTFTIGGTGDGAG